MPENYEIYGQAHQARALRNNPNLLEGMHFCVLQSGVAYFIREKIEKRIHDTMSHNK